MTTIRNKMATGALWMVLAKLAERSLGIVSMLILARVLVPHDFGIVAMAMSFVALLEMLGAFGFDVALIQRQTTERRYWDTVWTLELTLGVGIAVLMFFGSHVVAEFFKEPALVHVVWVLAIGSIAQGMQNVGVVAFRTEMRFDREFKFLTAKKLIGIGTTIPLAIALDSYWALVIGQTVGRVAGTALSYWVHPYRPRLTFTAFGELFGFSKWVLVTNCIAYLKERSSDWVIGRTAGPAALGAFTISYEIASLPSTELAAPINRAVFPAYAKLAKDDPDALSAEYLRVIGMIVLIATPAVLGVAATADLLVPVLLGPNWLQAIPVMTLLAFFGFTHIVQSNAQAAYLALGRADIPAKLNGLHVALQFGSVLLLAPRYGAVGAAAGYLATACFMVPISVGVVLRVLRLRVFEFLRNVWRPVVAGSLMYAAVNMYVERLGPEPGGPSAALHLFAAVIMGAVVYILGAFLLWVASGRPAGAEQALLNKASQVAGRFTARNPALDA